MLELIEFVLMLDPPFQYLPKGVVLLTHITSDGKCVCVCVNHKPDKREYAYIFQKFQEHTGIVALTIKSC